MKLTWADIEAHRGAATPNQWRRMTAYFKEGKGIAEIAADEGTGGKHYNSQFLSIGRGCMAVLKSMLQQPVRIPSELATVAAMRAVRERQTGEALASSSARAEGAAADVERGEASDELAPNDQERESAPQESRSLPTLFPEYVAHQPEPPTQAMQAIVLGMRVEGGNGVAHDAGRVENILGDTAVVAWDSGFKTFAPLANLTPLAP